jgi:glycolate oxidase FAD binding subunit
MLDFGLPPARPGVAVELRALDKVIDFPARDMTITVEAGITIARLNEITRAEGLHLPIDVPEPERATLGGAIACNVSGPRRYGYGTFRDYVLGITTVSDQGELVSAGGRVVKNVAGYDLMKLHTGALGTLGVITLVTLKLRPVPEDSAAVVCGCGVDRLAEVLSRIHQSATRPVAIEVWNTENPPVLSASDQWQIAIGYEHNENAVQWQAEQLTHELADVGIRESTVVYRHRCGELWQLLADAAVDPAFPFVCRASTTPSRVAGCCLGFLASLPNRIYAHAGTGAVIGSYSDSSWGMQEHANDVVQGTLWWRGEIPQNGSNYVIGRCPSERKKSLPVWGRPPADLALQKAVKRALDPNNLFNPGRFVTDAF